jgi:hypothetical protein
MIRYELHGYVNKEVAYVNAIIDVIHAYSLESCFSLELLDAALLDCFMICFDICLPLLKKVLELFITKSALYKILTKFHIHKYYQNCRNSNNRLRQKTIHSS